MQASTDSDPLAPQGGSRAVVAPRSQGAHPGSGLGRRRLHVPLVVSAAWLEDSSAVVPLDCVRTVSTRSAIDANLVAPARPEPTGAAAFRAGLEAGSLGSATRLRSRLADQRAGLAVPDGEPPSVAQARLLPFACRVKHASPAIIAALCPPQARSARWKPGQLLRAETMSWQPRRPASHPTCCTARRSRRISLRLPCGAGFRRAGRTRTRPPQA